MTTVLLLLISQLTGAPWPTATLVVLLGAFGLSANGVLIHLTVRFSTTAATLGAALSVSAFNCGTAIGTTVAGAAVTSSLGIAGPATIGTVIVALTLVPTITLALRKPLTEPDADRLVSASTECRRRPAGTRYRLAAAVTAALAQRPHTTPNDPTKRLMATADPRDSRHPHKPCCTL